MIVVLAITALLVTEAPRGGVIFLYLACIFFLASMSIIWLYGREDSQFWTVFLRSQRFSQGQFPAVARPDQPEPPQRPWL